MKIRPLSDRVLIKRLGIEETTKGGLSYLIPRRKNLKKEKWLQLVTVEYLRMAASSPWM